MVREKTGPIFKRCICLRAYDLAYAFFALLYRISNTSSSIIN